MGFGGYSYHTFQPRKRESGAYERLADGTEGKRVRRVHSVSQVIHIWAQRTQTNGESGKGNVYFEGDRLFDYGDHFCLGQFVTTPKGELVCFLNSDSYSITTSGHQSSTAHAVPPGIRKFKIPKAGYNRWSNEIDLPAILKSYEARVLEKGLKAKRAISPANKGWHASDANDLRDESIELAALFDHPYTAPEVTEAVATGLRHRAEALAKEKAEAEKHRLEDAEEFQKWLAGTSDHCPWSWARDEKGSAVMRVKGDKLQTSMGAEVPLAHAVRVFQFVKKCRAEGLDWKRNGKTIRVGHFQVDEIKANGDFKAGCHFFTWQQVETAARAAKVWELAPEDTTTATGH